MRFFRLAGLGAALMYFFDPQQGNRRRSMLRDRTSAVFRRAGRRAGGAAQSVSSTASGMTQKVTHLREEEKEQPNDATLARKVESEIFRGDDVPKGQISVNAENGVVFLRGEVERPELIQELEQAVRKVQGVQDVQNLLHEPGSPAPTAPKGSSS